MDGVGYSRCELCDEENFLRDGAKCALCLGLSYTPVDNEESDEESSNTFLDIPVAA